LFFTNFKHTEQKPLFQTLFKLNDKINFNIDQKFNSEILQKTFQVPIFEVITPAITKAVSITKSHRIGVIGTSATIASNVYAKKLHILSSTSTLVSKACPLLVPLVEEGWLHKKESKMIVRRYLHPLKEAQIDTLVLGCTHYPLLKEIIQPRIGKKVHLIDSSIEVAKAVKTHLDQNAHLSKSLERNTENLYYVSDMTSTASSIAKQIFGKDVTLLKTE